MKEEKKIKQINERVELLVDTGHKLNVHKTFRRHPEPLTTFAMTYKAQWCKRQTF